MTKRKTIEDHSSKYSYECRVCGDVARGLNFNVMTCMPCKTFFRKNAFKRTVSKNRKFFISSFFLKYRM
jgi:ribosomal protein L37AE/L43A